MLEKYSEIRKKIIDGEEVSADEKLMKDLIGALINISEYRVEYSKGNLTEDGFMIGSQYPPPKSLTEIIEGDFFLKNVKF